MSAPYPAKAVANYFLSLAAAAGKHLSPMKLQKLIYFAHGWHLAVFNGQPLIDEEVQAWDYGPVIQTIYHEFKDFGAGEITSKATDFVGKFTGPDSELKTVAPTVPDDDANTIALLKRVWEVYGGYSAIQLSNMTHAPNAPWDKARKDAGSLRSIRIPNEEIHSYFVAKAKEQKLGPTPSYGALATSGSPVS